MHRVTHIATMPLLSVAEGIGRDGMRSAAR